MKLEIDYNKLSEEIQDKVLNYLENNPQGDYLDLFSKFQEIFDTLEIQSDTQALKSIIYETYKDWRETQDNKKAQEKYQLFINWLSDYSC